MKRILVAPSRSIADGICKLPGWSARFDEIACVPLQELARRYHAIVPADQGAPPSFVSTEVRVALLCTELAAFERITRLAGGCDVLFMPSAVARLDLEAATRLTLRTARALKQGDRLALGDLATEPGGHGIGAEFTNQIVGRRIMYDLPLNAAVDFGMLGEAGDRR